MNQYNVILFRCMNFTEACVLSKKSLAADFNFKMTLRHYMHCSVKTGKAELAVYSEFKNSHEEPTQIDKM